MIASLSPQFLEPAVADFNRTNSLYRAELVDIQTYYGSWPDGIDKMILEIIAGRGPDIIHTYQLYQFRHWGKQGLFEDLYEMMDPDPVLNRSDFIKSIITGFETDGKLFQMAPGVSVRTIIGHPDVIGSAPGWNIDEFKDVINANPQAVMPLGSLYNGFRLLNLILTNNIECFINRETGIVSFDSDNFIELLDFAYNAESRFNQSNADPRENAPKRRISSGEQIMEIVSFSRFEEYSAFQDLFGGEFIFKGIPSEAGTGNVIESEYGLAITAVSENKSGAWEFVRMFISEGRQRQTLNNRSNIVQYIPTNKIIFEEKLTGAMVDHINPYIFWGDLVTAARPLSKEDTDKIRVLIDSVSHVPFQLDDPLLYLYMEVMQDFLNDRITAHDAARIMQNRASVYVSEQSG